MRLATFLLAVPCLALAAEDPAALLKDLAKAAAPSERMAAMKAIQAAGDKDALQAAWAKAVREKGALGLDEEQRANLWMERIYWGLDWRDNKKGLVAEMEAFKAAFPAHPKFVEGLKAVLNREARYGTLEALDAYVKAFGKDLPETDHAKYAERVSRFRAGGEVPELNLKDWDGKPFDLAALRGQPVLIYFWASG